MPSPTHATPRLARSSAPGSKAHIETLISLLEDDSPVVQAEVRGEFSRLGKTAYPALERAARSGPARRRARARQFLLSIARRRQVRRLIRYAARSKHDLETGLFLLDRHANPAADTRAHRRVLDIYGNKLHKRIQVLTPGEARVEAFVQFMAEEMGFRVIDATQSIEKQQQQMRQIVIDQIGASLENEILRSPLEVDRVR